MRMWRASTSAGGERGVHRVRQAARERNLCRREMGLDEDVARFDFGRLHTLHLDDVIAEGGLHHVGDLPRAQVERGVLETLQHHATTEPAELPALRARGAIG